MAEPPRDLDGQGLSELKALLVQVLAENAHLKRDVQQLRDENARLKGLNGKPDIKPSGMAKEARPRSGKKGERHKVGRRGSKNDKLVIDEEKVLAPDDVPEGSHFKGYEDYLVQDLILRPWTVLYRRQRWKTPDGATIMAPLPAGLHGHCGAGLVRFVLAQYHQCRVTLPLIGEQLHDFGVVLSERQLLRILIAGKAPFVEIVDGVFRHQQRLVERRCGDVDFGPLAGIERRRIIGAGHVAPALFGDPVAFDVDPLNHAFEALVRARPQPHFRFLPEREMTGAVLADIAEDPDGFRID